MALRRRYKAVLRDPVRSFIQALDEINVGDILGRQST